MLTEKRKNKSSSAVLFLSRDQVAQALSMEQAIDAMKSAFIQLSARRAVVPLRTHLSMPENDGLALVMPAYLRDQEQFGLKVASLFHQNAQKGLPLIHALVLVFDATSGRPLAIMDGEYLTALRTGAASGLATSLLARSDAETVAIFGAGIQARAQLQAVCAVRNIKRIYVFGRTPENTATFVQEMSESLGIPISPARGSETLAQVDIICTATSAVQPLFSHAHVPAGVHINAIGSYRPDVREIPGETVLQAKVVVDQRAACLSEAGDLLIPLNAGHLDENHLYAEIGEIAAGEKPGRQGDEEITLFKSVGNAVQDLAAADEILKNARKLGLGTELYF